MEDTRYFDAYESNLQQELLKVCTGLGMLSGEWIQKEARN